MLKLDFKNQLYFFPFLFFFYALGDANNTISCLCEFSLAEERKELEVGCVQSPPGFCSSQLFMVFLSLSV